MIFNMGLLQVALLLPLLLLSLTVHEWAHGKVAFLRGDPTAYEAGRLTLNPIKHIDIVGLLMLLMVGVGWAKPVPIDMRRLESPRRDLILVSLAGPVSNLLIGGVSALLARLYRSLALSGAISFREGILQVLVVLTVINGLLFFFNMLPIPPLDGSKVVGMLIPQRHRKVRALYFRYGAYLLIALLLPQILFDIPVIPFQAVTRVILRFIAGG
ncbi:MAG: site-2 protease family protein [Alkalispirochaetaceae bacterium]